MNGTAAATVLNREEKPERANPAPPRGAARYGFEGVCGIPAAGAPGRPMKFFTTSVPFPSTRL